MSKNLRNVVRGDEHGIFVWTNGAKYRPGDVEGYAHAYDMSDLGLRIGDKVNVRHIVATPLARIKRHDGGVAVWAQESQHKLVDHTPITHEEHVIIDVMCDNFRVQLARIAAAALTSVRPAVRQYMTLRLQESTSLYQPGTAETIDKELERLDEYQRRIRSSM